jgi:hypothetical protein
VRTGLGLGGLTVVAVLGWNSLSGTDFQLLFDSWAVPAVALLDLFQQAGCGCAWHSLIEPTRPSRWTSSARDGSARRLPPSFQSQAWGPHSSQSGLRCRQGSG